MEAVNQFRKRNKSALEHITKNNTIRTSLVVVSYRLIPLKSNKHSFSEYFLSIEHGSDINIFDIRRGRINYLDGGIKGVPRRSPFVRTDCTLKQRNSLYVIGALQGATTLSLYKSDPESQKWIGLGEIPENSLRAACESWQDRIWRCGGFVDEEKTIRSKRCFSFDGVEWREELSLNIGRAHHSMVSSTKSLYVFGGSGTVSSGEAINVNVRSNTWNVFAWVVDKEPTSPVLIAKRGEEHIWFVGGATHKDTTDIIWRFTPKDGRMIQMGRMTRARYCSLNHCVPVTNSIFLGINHKRYFQIANWIATLLAAENIS